VTIIKRLIVTVFLLLAAYAVGFAQTGIKNSGDIPSDSINSIKSSPAFAEILLRKVELQADLESFLADYTEENPKIIDIRFELGVLNKAFDKLFAVRPSEMSKLTLALGRLIVRQAGLETDLLRLQRSYNKDHPEVKRLKRKVEIYEGAIKEILP
jgi:hypothetical protein